LPAWKKLVHQEPHQVTDADDSRKLAELDRLLNDPDVRLEPARVWALLAEMRRDPPGVMAQGQAG